jgi:hypothetical protein
MPFLTELNALSKMLMTVWVAGRPFLQGGEYALMRSGNIRLESGRVMIDAIHCGTVSL